MEYVVLVVGSEPLFPREYDIEYGGGSFQKSATLSWVAVPKTSVLALQESTDEPVKSVLAQSTQTFADLFHLAAQTGCRYVFRAAAKSCCTSFNSSNVGRRIGCKLTSIEYRII